MASYIVPPFYAAFVWWFSTGAVLLLVGLSKGFDVLKLLVAAGLLLGSAAGLAFSADGTGAGEAYLAFTCVILMWGAQEIVFLAGWVTGPRQEPCPADAKGWQRFWLALQAIVYHEMMLLACGALVAAATWNGANQVGLWTFAALWILRQSAKINLFLGVPVTNDELMPDAVRYLKSYFTRKAVSAFFPLSVTLATGALVLLIQRLVEVSVTPFEIAGLTLVSTLFALGVLEHWFMLLPLPAMKLWGWGVKAHAPADNSDRRAGRTMPPALAGHSGGSVQQLPVSPSTLPDTRPERVVALALARADQALPKAKQICARQRLEDQFRKAFLEQHARGEMASARRGIGSEPAATVNGRTS